MKKGTIPRKTVDKELEAMVKILEDQVMTLQDIEEIKKFQRAYGYYIEHGMSQQLLDLFF